MLKKNVTAPVIKNMNFYKKNKYHNKKTECLGQIFDSKLEAAVYWDLRLMEKSGAISELQRQTLVYLTDAKILFKPDFCYFDLKSKTKIYLEVKGFETPQYKIKKRLWKYYGPGTLQIIKGQVDHNGFGRYKISETIIPFKFDDTFPKKVS